jgi:hypothetical protein
MQTKALVRFLNRAARFDGDLEITHVVGRAIEAGLLTPQGGESIFVGVDSVHHPRLAKQKPSDHNRKIVATHLTKTVRVAYVKDLYEDLASYLTDIVLCAARKGFSPDQLIGEHKLTVDANELLKAGSWESVLRMIAESLFRRMEGMRSTSKLIESLDKKLGLGLSPDLVAAALPYLELRHLLVHTDGVADESFCEKFPQFGAKPHEQIPMSHTVVCAARQAVTALVLHVDERLIAAGLVLNDDQQ